MMRCNGEGIGRTVRNDGPDFSGSVLVEDLGGEADRATGVDEVIDQDGNLSRPETQKDQSMHF